MKRNLAFVVPQVIAMRSLRLHDQLVFRDAIGIFSAMAQAWSPWMSPWQTMAAASRVLEQGMKPIHRRASANARRLRRRRR